MSALVTLGNIPYEQDYDICDLVQYVNLACPIKKGKFSVGMKMSVPDFIPAVSLHQHAFFPIIHGVLLSLFWY